MQDHLATDSKLRASPVILKELRLGAGVDDDVGSEPTMIDSSADQALDRSERRRRQQMERRLIVVLDRALRQQHKSLTKGCGKCSGRGRVIDSVLDSLRADQDGDVVVNLCPGLPPHQADYGSKAAGAFAARDTSVVAVGRPLAVKPQPLRGHGSSPQPALGRGRLDGVPVQRLDPPGRRLLIRRPVILSGVTRPGGGWKRPVRCLSYPVTAADAA